MVFALTGTTSHRRPRLLSASAGAGPDQPDMPTTGATRLIAPVEPWKTAPPKLKMPPSEATSQYPGPLDGVAIPTMGALRWMLPVDPWNPASPKEKMPPSDATSQYPPPPGVADMPTTGA